MVVRGAPAIGCAAAFGVVAGRKAQRRTRTRCSPQSRPDRGEPLLGARAHEEGDADLRGRSAWRSTTEDLAANRAMGKLGAELIPKRARVLTHCNTGALATGGLRHRARRHPLGARTRSISRDRQRDAALSAGRAPHRVGDACRRASPCTLITDNMAGHLMSRGEIDVVDRRRRPHRRQRRRGEQDRHLRARRAGEAPRHPVLRRRAALDLRSDDPRRLADPDRGAPRGRGHRLPRHALGAGRRSVRNPAFDVTPAELVTAIISEKGIASPPYRESIAALLK